MLTNQKTSKLLLILEIAELIEASFIIGLIIYLLTVIKFSYILNIMYAMLIICSIFLISALIGIYKYYKHKEKHTMNITLN